nr:glycosyl hydrolase [uncultured Rhodoferax sp.]
MTKAIGAIFVKFLFVAITLLNLTPAALGEPISKEYFGLHIHNADTGTPWPKVTFGSWRLWDARVQWPSIQPSKEKWDFAKLDLLIGLSQITKVEPLLPLGLTPRWASSRPNEKSAYGEGMAAEPASMEDWKQYIRTVANRYKGKIKYYEIWNEPNDKGFFSGSPEKLVELTCTAYQVLKEVDSTILVISPAYTGQQNIEKLEEFLQKGGAKCIDVIAHHFYVTPEGPEAIPAYVLKVRQAMKRQSVESLPLWNTEIGWLIENSDGSENGQATNYWKLVTQAQSTALIARAYLLGASADLGRFFWYSWDHKTMGLIEPASKKIKPAATAMSIVASWLIGNNKPICTELHGIWTCSTVDSPIEKRLIVWTTNISGKFSVPKNWRLIKIDSADGRTPVLSQSDSLKIDGIPQQFIFERTKQQ